MNWRDPVGVVWIGLSLHHLETPEKLNVMCDVRRIVGGQGIFAIYENTSPDGEDRNEWQKPHGTAYTDEEWGARRPTDVNQLKLYPDFSS